MADPNNMNNNGVTPDEQAHFNRIYALIRSKLEESGFDYDKIRSQFVESGRQIYEDAPHDFFMDSGNFDAATELLQYIRDVNLDDASMRQLGERYRKYTLLERSAFFGRMDFLEDGEEDPETIYIGVTQLAGDKAWQIEVCDWRAPICSMYYDNKKEDASFVPGEGREPIHGELTLRRQFRVRHDELQLQFDSDINVEDELLCRLLAENSTGRMGNIVSTIQAEQNQAVRNDNSRLLLVTGAAGSGKTVVAMHRIAWYIYRHRASGITSKNILLLTPNGIFADYISGVLPELGEENPWQTTVHELITRMVGSCTATKSVHLRADTDALRSFAEGKLEAGESELLRIKSSKAFAEAFRSYCEDIEAKGPEFSTIEGIEGSLVDDELLNALYHDKFKSTPYLGRLARMNALVGEKLRKAQNERYKYHLAQVREEMPNDMHQEAQARIRNMQEWRSVRSAIKTMLVPDVPTLHRAFYRPEVLKRYLPELTEEQLLLLSADKCNTYESAVELLYMTARLTGGGLNRLIPLITEEPEEENPDNPDENEPRQVPAFVRNIKHLLIDEAQNLTPLELAVLGLLFPEARLTVLMDPQQITEPWREPVQEEDKLLLWAFKVPEGRFAAVHLTRSYRSTAEITDYAEKLIDRHETVAVRGGGEPVHELTYRNPKELLLRVRTEVQAAVEAGYRSVGVITRNAHEAKVFAELLGGSGMALPVYCISDEHDEWHDGIICIPCYNVKGLEFDAVVTDSVFDDAARRHLSYVVCTRARHRLSVLKQERK